jgi:hypothetical protein
MTEPRPEMTAIDWPRISRRLQSLADGLRAIAALRHVCPHPAFSRYAEREREVMRHAR